MILAVVWLAIGACLCFGLVRTAHAQEAPPADPNRIQFDLNAGIEDPADEGDWNIGSFVAASRATDRADCGTASDLLAVQSTSRARYDENGALIREAPSAACVPPGSRFSDTGQALRAAEQQEARDRSSAAAMLREPDCMEDASGYACSASGQAGRNTYERSAQCRETATGRTCSSSFSIGNSEDGRNAAREALESMRDD